MTGGYHSDGTNWYGRLQHSGGNCCRRYPTLTGDNRGVDEEAREAENRKVLADWAKTDFAKLKADSD
jgi:predicted alpha/beta hydrolase